MPHHARQRHIGGGNGVHRADDIALDAGDLHQTRHGVADKPLQIGQRHGKRLGSLLGCAVFQHRQRRGSHSAGSTDLSLAAALRPCQGGSGGDDLPEPGGNIQRAADCILVGASGAEQRQQHGGQNTAAARRGCRHDAFHTGVALGGFQGFGNDLGKVAVGIKPALPGGLRNLGGVAPGVAAHRAVGAAIPGAGGAHDAPQAVHFGFALGAGQTAFGKVAFQNDFIQRTPALLAGIQHGTDR